MASNLEKKIYTPRPSAGWVWVGMIALVVLATAITLFIKTGLSGPFLVMILITAPIGIGFLMLAIFFPTMRYEIDGRRLIVTYGPLIRYVIELDQIVSIRRCDMRISIVSSFRFPGLALFTVPYLDIGNVKMCATAASKGILLIETASTKYGLTPADEQGFVMELQERMKK